MSSSLLGGEEEEEEEEEEEDEEEEGEEENGRSIIDGTRNDLSGYFSSDLLALGRTDKHWARNGQYPDILKGFISILIILRHKIYSYHLNTIKNLLKSILGY